MRNEWIKRVEQLENTNKELLDAGNNLQKACDTLMDELVGKKATDWGIVNDALCQWTKARKPKDEN